MIKEMCEVMGKVLKQMRELSRFTRILNVARTTLVNR